MEPEGSLRDAIGRPGTSLSALSVVRKQGISSGFSREPVSGCNNPPRDRLIRMCVPLALREDLALEGLAIYHPPHAIRQEALPRLRAITTRYGPAQQAHRNFPINPHSAPESPQLAGE